MFLGNIDNQAAAFAARLIAFSNKNSILQRLFSPLSVFNIFNSILLRREGICQKLYFLVVIFRYTAPITVLHLVAFFLGSQARPTDIFL